MTTLRRTKTGGVTSLIVSFNLEILDHPPFYPDLSSCGYSLFPEVKENMRGIRYSDLEDLEAAVFSYMTVVAKQRV